jgi:hypothetical protein
MKEQQMKFRLPDDRTTPTREELLSSEGGRNYLKSWLLLRLFVGILGLLLPILLIVGDIFWLTGSPGARGSLSAYYHSGLRDFFVGTLWVIGLFLIGYMISHYNPLQQKLGEATVAHIHLSAAGVYIGLLAIMSFRFSRRERDRGRAGHRLLHLSCATVMVCALTFLGLTALAHVTSVASWTPLLIAEIACTAAFGLSWFVKGAEIRKYLFGAPPGIDERMPEAPTLYR